MFEQLDLLDLIEKEDVVQKRLNYLKPLLEKHGLSDLKIVAVNKYYEWSVLAEKDGYMKCYEVFETKVCDNGSLGYPFERVVNGTLNFLLI